LKTFRCSHCHWTVYFENVRCEQCGHVLGFVLADRQLAAFEPQENGQWQRAGDSSQRLYRQCKNYKEENVCNWMIEADDPNPYCSSCRLTKIIPALSTTENKQRWFRLEQAKRRLIYSLYGLRLPIKSRDEDPDHGLAFQFLEDVTPEQRVLTGHDRGVITLNVAEADDAKREEMRHAMHEPYRTLLGHFRHEIGHYYWDLLIENTPRLERFREVFGDERQSYAEALDRHYREGPPADWPQRFISAYASTHPWEDWAECWAHALHMNDGLHTAQHWGFTLHPEDADQAPAGEVVVTPRSGDFDTRLLDQWIPLTRFLNSLNRSLGHADAYPFTMPQPVIEKLRFIDTVIREPRV